MCVNIEIVVKNVGTLRPKWFYFKGEGSKMKVVVVGCQKEGHNKQTSYPFKDCEIYLKKINESGDEYSI